MVIARIDIEGNIDHRMLVRISPALESARKRNRISAVIININSPGGGATTSELLVSKIKEISKKKPVYSIITGMGASGAYWVASATHRIFAMSTSIVGSIGVISMVPSLVDLLDKIGVKVDVAKVGEYKSMMSPFEKRGAEEREHLESILTDIFESFKNDVIESRKIKKKDIPSVINGDIFSSKKALDNGLIDSIGTIGDAARELAQKLEISERVKNITPRMPFVSRMVGMAVDDVFDRGLELMFRYR